MRFALLFVALAALAEGGGGLGDSGCRIAGRLVIVLNASSYEDAAKTSASFLARRAARTAYCASSIASAANSMA